MLLVSRSGRGRQAIGVSIHRSGDLRGLVLIFRAPRAVAGDTTARLTMTVGDTSGLCVDPIPDTTTCTPTSSAVVHRITPGLDAC